MTMRSGRSWPVRQDQFWGQVAKTETCWLWTGRTRMGYGIYSAGSMAHRIAYVLTKGEIPTGLQVDHLCLVTLCVNPEHLEAVTPAENIRRRYAGMTHCKHGHPRTPDNTYWWRGKRTCRPCNRAAKAKAVRRRSQ